MGKIITITLPHDLPENWNENQYVSPGGTEVGLTPQHGYNYLMEQVNNAQKAIKELDENATKNLVADITLYVEKTGNDDVGDGTADNPFATIQKAISIIPNDLSGKTVTISIGEGTFAPFTLARRSNGHISIKKSSALTAEQESIIQGSCTVSLCGCRLSFNNLKFVAVSEASRCIAIQGVNEIGFYYCKFDGANLTSDGIRILSGDVNCGITYCVFENCEHCVNSLHDSGTGGLCSISFYSCTGVNNKFGCYNNFAVLAMYGITDILLGCDTLMKSGLTAGPTFINGQLYTNPVAPAELVEE